MGAPEQLNKWLVDGQVDVAITYGLHPEFGGSSRELIRASPQALVPRNDPIAALREISLEQLAEHPIVQLDVPWLSTYASDLFSSLRKRPQVSFRSGSYFTVCRAVAAGFGIAVVNDLPGPSGSMLEPGCIRIPITGNLPQFVLHVADNFGTQKPEYIRHLVDALVDYFHRDYNCCGSEELCVA